MKNKKPIALKPAIDRKEIQLTGKYSVKDVWRKKEVSTDQSYVAEIPAHDVVLLRLSKK